jgi:hypothetical protein
MPATLDRRSGFRLIVPQCTVGAETTHTPTFFVNRAGLASIQKDLNRFAQGSRCHNGNCQLDHFVAASQLIATLQENVPSEGYLITLTELLELAVDPFFNDTALRDGLRLLLRVLGREDAPIDSYVTVAD